MSGLRKILLPFSILYDGITSLRNTLFDIGILRSTRFELPVIVVGNLSVGGTGKTPHIEYLIQLLKNSTKIAVLSRGYKRKSKGFVIAAKDVTVQELGDEPFQYFLKFKEMAVAVDEDRVHGINSLLKMETRPEIILLDDAFQHRKVHASFNILLTAYGDLYVDDFLLPAGNLRESSRGAKRAEIIVVTKCPDELLTFEKQKIREKLKLKAYQKLFFSKVSYANEVINENDSISLNLLKNYSVILITGIAKPKPMVDFLNSKKINFRHLKYADHHNFSELDIQQITKEFESISVEKKIILTTEKDYARLKNRLTIFYLEIKVSLFDREHDFDNDVITCLKSHL
jgi:tetraacyldisaccharide 4'-kinase